MFEICACPGDRPGGLRRFGGLLGMVYHGCDDVGDVRGRGARRRRRGRSPGRHPYPAGVAGDRRPAGAVLRPDPAPSDLARRARVHGDVAGGGGLS